MTHLNSGEIAQSYDLAAESYSAGRDAFDNSRYINALSDLLLPNSTVLDLGCGAGVPTDRILTDRGYSIHGIDISPRQIELAKQHVPEGQFEVRDMLSLEESELSVDGIISLYAIYHTPRETHSALFRTLRSFLPNGGPMFALLGAKDWEGTKQNFHGVPMSWSMSNPDSNRLMLQDAGFEIVTDEIDTTGGERHHAVMARKLPDKLLN